MLKTPQKAGVNHMSNKIMGKKRKDPMIKLVVVAVLMALLGGIWAWIPAFIAGWIGGLLLVILFLVVACALVDMEKEQIYGGYKRDCKKI